MAGFRLSRLAEADLTDIGTYTLRTWVLTRRSDISAILKPVAKGWPRIPNWAEHVGMFVLACDEWNTAALFSTGKNPEEYWSHAFFTGRCLWKDT